MFLMGALGAISKEKVVTENKKNTNNFSEIQELELAIAQQRKIAKAVKDHESNALLQRLLETRARLIREQRESLILISGDKTGT